MKWITTLLLLITITTINDIYSQCSGVDFEEQNGIAVIEMESVNHPSQWQEETNASGYTGSSYLAWRGSDSFSNPGNGIITYKVKINSTGIYRFQWRNKVGIGDNSTEHNDSWLKFTDAFDFFAQKGNSVKYPNGGSFKKSNSVVAGASANGWMKVFSSGTTAFNWTSFTSDREDYKVYAQFTSPGVYTIQVSGRSNGHFIDRMVLYKESSYSESNATNTSRSETLCDGSGGGTNCDNLNLTLNPSSISTCDGNDGAVSSSVSGAQGSVSYSWSNGSNSSSISNLSAGSYSLTITDSEGCTSTKSVVLSEPNSPNATLGSLADVSENDQPFQLYGGNPSGGTYSGPGVSNNMFDPSIGPGTYTITYTYTDPETECTDTGSSPITVTEGTNCDALSVALQGTDISTCEGTDGSVITTVSGAQGSVSYSWSNGSTTANIQGISAGTYSVTVTDQQGCTTNSSITLTEPDLPTVSLSQFPNLQTTDDPLILTAGNPQGGTYSGPGVTDGIFNPNIGAGTYQITYTYTDPETQCSNQTSGSISVVEPVIAPQVTALLLLNADTDEVIGELSPGQQIVLSQQNTSNFSIQAVTDPQDTGSVVFSLSGDLLAENTENEPPYTLFGNNGNDIYGQTFSLGIYTISATAYTEDNATGFAGDTFSLNFSFVEEITDCSSFNLSVMTENDTSCTIDNGRAEAVITGGQGSVIIEWSNGTSGQTVSGLSSGSYTVTATDANNCTVTRSFDIEDDSTLPIVTLTEFNPVTNEDDPVLLTGGSPEGGMYSGINVEGSQFSPSGLEPGLYVITYTYTDENSDCTNSATQEILVTDADITYIDSEVPYIFPNPVQNLQYTLRLPETVSGELNYGIFNSSGVLLDKGKIDVEESIIEFDLNSLIMPIGLYYLVLEGTILDRPVSVGFLVN